MITNDELAELLTPPAGSGPAYPRQLNLSDRGMDLAETILDETLRGPAQDQALTYLVAAMRLAYTAVPSGPTPDTETPEPLDGALPVRGLVLDVGVWRLGLRMSRFAPNTRLTGLVLADFCGPSGQIPEAHQPSLRDLSEQTGLAMHLLHVHLQDLAASGWITRHVHVDASGRRSTFQLRLPRPHR